MTARSSAYNGSSPYGYMSESITYSSSYPDGYPSWNLLKDGGSFTMATRSSAYIGSSF